ncbi:RmuC family [Metamycoplasma cloacale]|uniref:DNA recombination protein RmuC n=1 Tax=Metamycoplasma cloacale TaxID=92401 RepID=A0A2Z4LMG2_9BACT|nr:DNA recombination protein RmuC [Metamycoplasma cloacale]AWX42982.1 DNA recombination protein RmuC [Metamycoplasma cloacale]VEU79194.1 RmuC family [Metamycoplasma cloacale]
MNSTEIVLILLVVIAILIALGILIFLIIKTIKDRKRNNTLLNQELQSAIAKEIKDSIIYELKEQHTDLLTRHIVNINDFNDKANSIKTDVTEAVKNIETVKIDINNLYMESNRKISENLNDLNKTLMNEFNSNRELLNNNFNILKGELNILFKTNVKDNTELIEKSINNLNNETNKMKEIINDGIKQIKDELNEQFKNELQVKLNEYFGTVDKSMQNLTTHVTKFETLQQEVTQLNKAFNDNKRRGNFGELSLELLLQNNYNSALWEAQFRYSNIKQDKVKLTEKEKGYIVDFVFKTFDKNGEIIYVPIDSKFSIQTFLDIKNAKTIEELKVAEHEFKKVIKEKAKDINKYIIDKVTTPYGIMYLPSEAIYAEALSDYNLAKMCYDEYRVMIAGPTTISAFISNIAINMECVNISNNISKMFDLFKYISLNYNNVRKEMEASKKSIDKTNTSIERAIKSVDKVHKEISKSKFISVNPTPEIEPILGISTTEEIIDNNSNDENND